MLILASTLLILAVAAGASVSIIAVIRGERQLRQKKLWLAELDDHNDRLTNDADYREAFKALDKAYPKEIGI